MKFYSKITMIIDIRQESSSVTAVSKVSQEVKTFEYKTFKTQCSSCLYTEREKK